MSACPFISIAMVNCDRSVSWLYLDADADPDRKVSCDRDMENVAFCTLTASNDSHVALSQHPLSYANIAFSAKMQMFKLYQIFDARFKLSCL